MKNKKYIIYVAIIAILLITVICCIIIHNKKTPKAQTSEEPQNEIETRIPDTVIKSTAENPIEKNGLEVTNIEIFKLNPTYIEVNATIVNHSSESFPGFFIEIGLYDKKGKYITSVAENYKEELKSNETYILKSGVGDENKIPEISSAKLITLKGELSSSVQTIFDNNPEE